MTKHDRQLNYEQMPLDFIRVSMDPLYEKLLKTYFSTSALAIEYCRAVCAEYGFTVKQEASANKNIYVYCSREGLPDSQRNPKPSPQRKRPSKRCDCRWRVVLSENENKQWEFRKSMNPTASEHNHAMMTPDEMVTAWPIEVNNMIIQLARQKLQTHEIREAVRQTFPNITWNERRFYNRLTEERKRMRQRGVVERAQRLLILSGKLCSLVASNEEWTTIVEEDLKRMLEDFCQIARLPSENLSSLTDLQPQMIQFDSDGWVSAQHVKKESTEEGSPTKKRRSSSKSVSDNNINHNSSESQKGVQLVYVPSYTLQLYKPSEDNKKNYTRTPLPQQCMPLNNSSHTAFGSSTFFPLASPTSSASSPTSSSAPFKRQIPMPQSRITTSPPQQAVAHNEYTMPYHNSSYTISHPSFTSYSSFTTSPPEMNFFEPNMVERERPSFYAIVNKGPSSNHQQEYHQRMQRTYSQPATNFSLPMIRSSEELTQDTTSHWN